MIHSTRFTAVLDTNVIPQDYLATFGLCAKSADDFLTDTIDLNPDTAIKVLEKWCSIGEILKWTSMKS